MGRRGSRPRPADWRDEFAKRGLIPPTKSPALQAPEEVELRELTNAELWDMLIGLCSKVAVDDESGAVRVDDLVELRDKINDLRRRVTQGDGYKAFPALVRPD
jgi:hypothetical protein